MSHVSPKAVLYVAQMLIIAGGCISLIAGTFWMVWLFRAFRRDVQRAKNGLCMHCGYDLRQSKDRCPECGNEILIPRR